MKEIVVPEKCPRCDLSWRHLWPPTQPYSWRVPMTYWFHFEAKACVPYLGVIR
jgi:hypothetical protein